MLPDPLLHISGTQINRHVDRAGQRIRLLPIVNGARRKPSLSVFLHPVCFLYLELRFS